MKKAYDAAARRRRHARDRLAKYGITKEQYDAMYERQRGLCDVCAKPLTGHPNIDHDHKTGRVRGLLCWWCNRFIGNNRNTPLMFLRAAHYLASTFDARLL